MIDGVIHGESEDIDCDEVISQNEVNHEESEQDEVNEMKEEAHSTGKVMHIEKSVW